MALRRRRTAVADDRARSADRGAGTGAVATGRNAAGGGLLLVARLIRLVAFVIAAIIVAAILLRVLDANASNQVVKAIHDAGKALVGPFKDLFKISNPKTAIAVNWGIAAALYAIVGSVIASFVARAALATRVT